MLTYVIRLDNGQYRRSGWPRDHHAALLMEFPDNRIAPGGLMLTHRSLALATLAAAALTVVAGCSAFHSKPAVEMSAKDVNLNTRWHASIASPAGLAGVVQMSGTASMAPGTKPGTTQLLLNVANSTPGGVHPWAVHLGQCGADEGVFGALENYQPLTVGSDGKGASSASVALVAPAAGNYFVSVKASAANDETTIACGNFAAPTQ
jgi:hypothetical protein